jgi:hypothetical protein
MDESGFANGAKKALTTPLWRILELSGNLKLLFATTRKPEPKPVVGHQLLFHILLPMDQLLVESDPPAPSSLDLSLIRKPLIMYSQVHNRGEAGSVVRLLT